MSALLIAMLQYFGHLMRRAKSLEKTLMLGNIKRQKEKRVAEDEMVGWHHQLNGQESEQTLRESEGHGSLACCSPWGRKESDTTQQLSNNSEPVARTMLGTEQVPN